MTRRTETSTEGVCVRTKEATDGHDKNVWLRSVIVKGNKRDHAKTSAGKLKIDYIGEAEKRA